MLYNNYYMCHFAHIWLVRFQFEISNPEHNLHRSRLVVQCKLLLQWKPGHFHVAKTQD